MSQAPSHAPFAVCVQVFMKATKVDGIYDCDPVKFPLTAQRFSQLTYGEVSQKGLQVGATHLSVACEHNAEPNAPHHN